MSLLMMNPQSAVAMAQVLFPRETFKWITLTALYYKSPEKLLILNSDFAKLAPIMSCVPLDHEHWFGVSAGVIPSQDGL